MYKKILVLLLLFISTTSLFTSEFKFYGMGQTWITYEQTEPVPGLPGVPDENSGFRIRRAIVGMRSTISDVFSYTFNLEFAYKDSPALDIFLNGAFDKLFNVRLGQFIPGVQVKEATIVPTELAFYEYSDLALNTAAYSGFSALRDVGLEFYGSNDLFKYSAYYGNGTGRFNFNNSSQYIKNRKPGDGVYGLRLDFFPAEGLRIGGHFNINSQDSVVFDKSIVNYDRYTYSLGFGINDFLMKDLYGEMDYVGGEVKDSTINSTAFTYRGWQVTLGYRILKELHALGRYETCYTENRYIQGTGHELTNHRYVVGLSWFWFKDNVDIVKVALNYHIKNESPDKHNNVVALLVQAKF